MNAYNGTTFAKYIPIEFYKVVQNHWTLVGSITYKNSFSGKGGRKELDHVIVSIFLHHTLVVNKGWMVA